MPAQRKTHPPKPLTRKQDQPAEGAAVGTPVPSQATPLKSGNPAPPRLSLLARLHHQYPDSSKSTLRGWIEQGRIAVDGRVVRDPRTPVAEAQRVELQSKAVIAPLRSGASLSIPILYRDPHLVVIEKPAGLLSVAAAYEKEECARALLQRQLRGDILPVHRLDRETSGVLCFARTPEMQEALKQLFAAHDLERQYVAVVEGHLESVEGAWDCWLWEDPISYQVHVCSDEKEGAQRAITHYRVLEEGPARSLLELTLETGRKHQIRVHCAAAGAPVLGDPRYGQEGGRLALHAQLLALRHPIFREMVIVRSPQPRWFSQALHRRPRHP